MGNRKMFALKNDGKKKEGGNMTNEDRKLIVETLGEMRELKGQMREFKEHVSAG